MPTLFQINATANWGSTGKIAEQIGNIAMLHGWDSYIAYGRHQNNSINKLIKVGNNFNVYEHYLENRILDNEGLASRCATKRLINKIKQLSPDIIHLHNIHDHWLNYQILFEFLNSIDTPVVWTQHDCWAFTGGCSYYSLNECFNWQVGCDVCPYKHKLFDRSKVQFDNRKQLFLSKKNLTIVPVSRWLEQQIRQSFMKDLNIIPIFNGVDIDVFKQQKGTNIRQKYSINGTHILIAVATAWTKRKGFDDYIRLSHILPQDYTIVLVGLPNELAKDLPANIIAIPITNNVYELVDLYSEADIVLNLSYEETFGLTTVEGMSCGTPSIVYNSTASPELITPNTGIVVERGDVQGVLGAIDAILTLGKNYYSDECRKRAVELYDKQKSYEKYIKLYNELLKRY